MRQFYNIYIHKWQMAEKVHIIIIHNNRNTMKNKMHKIGQCRIYKVHVSKRILKAYFIKESSFCKRQTLLEFNKSI